MDDRKYDFFAFISYKREDEKWAKWLQRKLEYYKLPSSVRKDNPDLPEKIRPVFKDTTDLEPGVLARKIQDALDSSKYLIVICSPRSANSVWVSKEVQAFIDSGRSDHIIPFIIGGIPNASDPKDECFPEGLRQLAGEQELLGANINEMGREAAAIKVVARMFNLRFDTLWQRYERTKKKKQILYIISFVLFVLMLSGVAWYTNKQSFIAEKAVSERNIQQLYSSYLECEKQYSQHQYSDAFKMAQMILRDNPVLPDSLHDMYEYILRMSYQKYNSDTLQLVKQYTADFNQMDWGPMAVAFDSNKGYGYIGCNGFAVIDIESGQKIVDADFWPQDIKISGDKVITFDDDNTAVYDKNTLKPIKKIKISTNAENYQSYVFSSNDGSRFLTRESEAPVFNIWDTQRGEIIQSFVISGSTGSISGDGKVFATIENEKVKLYDIDSKNELSLLGVDYANELQFDQSGKWLLLYLGKYDKIRIVNLSSGEDYLIPSDSYASHKTDWSDSYNFDGSYYANKYYVSDDGAYIAVGKYIYQLSSGKIIKQLESPDLAQGIMIYNEAKKVIQINHDRSIYVYVRSGSDLFKMSNIDFLQLLENDTSNTKFEIKNNNGGLQFYKNGELYGEIKGLYTDIYHISISNDGVYALISQLNRPTTLYCIKTGLPIEEYPFESNDGHDGFGVIDKDSILNFSIINGVMQFKFIPLNELLSVQIE